MERQEVVAEITALLKTGCSERIFNECAFCFRCNKYCSENLRPHELILEKFMDARKKKGKISAVIPYLFNGMQTSMWQDICSMLSKTERGILKNGRTCRCQKKFSGSATSAGSVVGILKTLVYCANCQNAEISIR